ncbi:glycosyltransferase [Dermabacteraceae bacterium TAE3-ERU5]|nr:glycosyltransferase [Dermabacteraceae bacterium TAE3-ERU5]
MINHIVFYKNVHGPTGGTTTVVNTFAKEFASRGYKVSFLSSQDVSPKGIAPHFSLNKHIGYTSHNPISRKFPGPFKLKLALKLLLTPLWDIYRNLRTKKYVNALDSKTCIMLVERSEEALILLREILALPAADRPKVITQYHSSFHAYNHGGAPELLKEVAKLSNAFGVLSEADAKSFASLFDVPTFYSHNPIPLPEQVSEYTAERKEILFVGRITGLKRPQLLLDAFERISNNFSDWTLRYVGGGEQLNQIKERAKEAGLIDRVFFSGDIPSTDVLKCYEAAGLTVLPSITEGQPMVLLESASRGVPVIATPSSPATCEIASQAGWVCSDETTSGLAELISTAISDFSARQQKSDMGKKLAAEYATNTVVDFWEDLMSSPKTISPNTVYPETN